MPHALAAFVLLCAAGWLFFLRAYYDVKPGERLLLLATAAVLPAAAHVRIAVHGRAADPSFVVPVMLVAYGGALSFIVAALCDLWDGDCANCGSGCNGRA